MKSLIIITVAVLSAASLVSCADNNGSQNTGKNKDSNTAATQPAGEPTSSSINNNAATSTEGIVNGYLQLKNALANDNGSDAASSGKAILDAMAKVDKASLSAEQSKAYEDVADDIKENAEHISENSGKIEHQREHFSMLSQDMYDLVKAFGSNQKLYQDSCPMYDNGKGAVWISEIKDIKNPYLGKKMPTCGTVKEEIAKQ